MHFLCPTAVAMRVCFPMFIMYKFVFFSVDKDVHTETSVWGHSFSPETVPSLLSSMLTGMLLFSSESILLRSSYPLRNSSQFPSFRSQLEIVCQSLKLTINFELSKPHTHTDLTQIHWNIALSSNGALDKWKDKTDFWTPSSSCWSSVVGVGVRETNIFS